MNNIKTISYNDNFRDANPWCFSDVITPDATMTPTNQVFNAKSNVQFGWVSFFVKWPSDPVQTARQQMQL